MSALAMAGALALCIVGGSAACCASMAAAAGAGPYVSVEYADTFQGTGAMFAVRACAGNEFRVLKPDGGAADPRDAARAPNPVHAFIRESKQPVDHDVVVRVVDVDGREISRHVGAGNVCGYARIAAAFVAEAGGGEGGGAR